MEPKILEFALISVIVSIDNALLAGMILPWRTRHYKKEIMIKVGVALGVSQIILAIGVGQLLSKLLFRALAILILIWMSIRTMSDIPSKPREQKTFSKVFCYTVFGNLDNMIWLGSELKGKYLWLVCFSIITIPLFVTIAIFLSNECEKHRWILMIGSGMMAWAAAGLIIETPGWRILGNYIAFPIPQVLIGISIFCIGTTIKYLRRIQKDIV